jgi:hypothetical protein
MRIISDIKGLDAYREDCGDITALAASIRDSGLSSPIIVTSDDWLISGSRRIRAALLNGSTAIPAVVVRDAFEAVLALEAEKANGGEILQKPMLLTEMSRQRSVVTSLRTKKKIPGFRISERMDAYHGISNRTSWTVRKVVEAYDASGKSQDMSVIYDEVNQPGKMQQAYRNMLNVDAPALQGRVYTTINSLREQRETLDGVALQARSIAHVLRPLEEIHPRMSQEEISRRLADLIAGRTALAKTINTLRKAQQIS